MYEGTSFLSRLFLNTTTYLFLYFKIIDGKHQNYSADKHDDIAVNKASDQLGFLQEHSENNWRAFIVS